MALGLGAFSKIPPKQRILLAVLMSLLLGAGYYYAFYQKMAAETARLRTQLNEMQSKIREQEVIAGNLPSFQTEVRKLEAQLGVLLDQLPNSAEIPSLLKSVSNLGRDAGLEFVKFAPRAEVRKEFYAEIPVTIQVTGGYHGFVAFADRLGHLPRIVNLSDIVFSQPKAGARGVHVGVACTAMTYRFIESAAAPAGKGAGK